MQEARYVSLISWTLRSGSEQSEWDMQKRTGRPRLPGQDSQDRTHRKELPGQNCQDRAPRIGLPANDYYDKTTRAGQK